jgi:hypothetical protein
MGFSVVMERGEGTDLSFSLWHRALPADQEIKVTEGPYLAYTSHTGISFCPWCGQDLKVFYGPQLRRPGVF